MAMNTQVQIRDDGVGLTISMSAPGAYNPDELDDLKRRAVGAYKEAMTFRESLIDQTQSESGDSE